MLLGLAVPAGKDSTMESSDKISIYQLPLGPGEFASHYDKKNIMRYLCKFDSLDIIGPYHAAPVSINKNLTNKRTKSRLQHKTFNNNNNNNSLFLYGTNLWLIYVLHTKNAKQ